MKQFLRLRGLYCPKRTQPTHHIHLQYAPDKRNTYTGNWLTRSAFFQTFSCLSSHFYRESIGAHPCRVREILRYFSDTPRIRHARWQNKVSRKAYTGRWGYGLTTVRNSFDYGSATIRQLLGFASPFSRSLAEGLSKASRTLVEALSKDCRTSLEQQSNNCRRNIEESCVCTHAKAPARSGLGLALGLVVLLFVAMGQQGFAQESFSVSGKVISATSGQAIEGATVTNKRTRIHTVTDRAGEYRIAARPDDILVYTFVGYRTMEEEINGRQQIIVSLDPADHILEEVDVVSTGYQTIPKERATGSFVFVDSALLNRAVSTDIISRLKGVVPSLLFDERAGGEPKLSIRGRSTIYANADPLIVVDNFPYEGDIRNINPNDVESVSILRDAAAASIWGVRAGNGVIVITTKRGKAGQPLQVSFNGNVTVGEKPDLWYEPRISPAEQIEVEKLLYEKGYYNSNLNNTTTYPLVPLAVEILASPGLTPAQREEELSRLAQNNLIDDISDHFYRAKVSQQYTLGIRGASEKHRYYLSGGFDRNLDNERGASYRRLNFNADHSFTFSRRLELQTALSVTNTERQGANVVSALGETSPYQSLVDKQGNPQSVIMGHNAALFDRPEQQGLLDWSFIPLDEIDYRQQKNTVRHVRLNSRLKYTLAKGLGVILQYQYEQQAGVGNNFYDQRSFFVRDLVNRFASFKNGSTVFNLPYGSILYKENGDQSTQNGRVLAVFDRDFNKGSLSLLAGWEIREAKSNRFSNTYFGYDPENGTSMRVNLDTTYRIYPAGTQRIASIASEGISGYLERHHSAFLNGSYQHLGRYTLSWSARMDQTNLFGVKANQRSVPLWSAGLKWDVSKEGFYRMDWLPVLSLRATYGYNGNFDATATAFVTASYGTSRYRLREATLGQLPNPELRAERTAVWNMGIDFASESQRIGGRLDYYKRRSNNLIGFGPIDPTTGRTIFRGNLAHMGGHGVDVEITTDNLRKRLEWRSTLLVSYTEDKVLQYLESPSSSVYFSDASLLGHSVMPVEGKPLFSVYSYRWAGLDGETGDPMGYIDDSPSADYAAIQRSILSPDDLQYHGTAQPRFFGAVRNEFSFRRFSLSVNVSYKLDYYFRRASLASSSFLRLSGLRFPDYAKRWQKPGDEQITQVPAFAYPVSSARNNFYQNSSVLVERGDHIRLQDLQISYSFKGCRVYGYANNLGIIWRANRHGIDPDFNQNIGSGNTTWPLPRTFAIGFQADF